MDAHHTARLLAIGRMIIGAVLVVGPGMATRALGVETPSRLVKMLARTTGARDLVLGIGAFTALADGRDASRWVRMGALADAADAVAVATARRELGTATVVGGGIVAAAAAVVGTRAADELDA